MSRILLLISNLDYGGAARQVSLLGAHLPRHLGEVRVAVLGGHAPWVDVLRVTGCPVDCLGWQRPIDVAPFLALRRLLRSFRPTLIHVWDRPALRSLALVGGPGRARLIVTDLLVLNQKPGVFDRWLSRQATLAPLGQASAERHRQLGTPAERLAVLLPAVEEDSGTTEPAVFPSLPDGARVLLAIGPFHASKGFREAVWALDILHYLYDDLNLVLVGGGAERERVVEFSRFLGVRAHVHFPGNVADVRPWLRRAELVWVPSRSGGGISAALEAMAAGKAVVATNVPALAEVVGAGETGLLFNPGDQADLARQTRQLLDDAARRSAFGAAGRQRVSDHFTMRQLIERCTQLYFGGTEA